MGKDSIDSLEAQRNKRKRVARMKKMIVSTIITWMLVSLLVMCVLTYKVLSLQHQINDLSEQISSSEVSSSEVVSVMSEGESDELFTVDNLDNLAEEGDIPTVYLTFDDGPSDSTDEILDVLDDYNVKATFFVVGKDVEEYGDQYKRIVDEGHTIGMHSYSHNYSKLYSSEEAFESDFHKIHDLILDTTGVDSKLYRFPGGSSNRVSNTSMIDFIRFLNTQDVNYFDWNIVSGDATSRAFTSDELVDNVMSDVVKYKTSVVLLHDASNKKATVEALPKLIEELQAAGAMILPISEDTTVIQHMSVVQ